MRKISILLGAIILFILSANAQKKKHPFRQFEIGGEGGFTIDYLTVRDPAGNLLSSSGLVLGSGIGGPRIRRYINKNIFIEAAFLWKENTFGFYFKQQPDYGGWGTNGSQTFMIPIRAGYELSLSKKVSLNTTAGIVPSFITLHGGSYGYGTSNPGNISYSYEMRNEYKKTYITIQPGISLSHLIRKRIRFSYGVNYYHGLSDAELYDVSYRINNGPVQNAVIAHRGSFINYNGSLSYLFSIKRKIK